MDIDAVLSTKVTFQHSVRNSTGLSEVAVGEVLTQIKDGRHKEHCSKLVKMLDDGDTERYKVEKLYLPAATFAATFNGSRRKTHIKEYSRLLVLDIDGLEIERHKEVGDILSLDPYVVTFWTSPSNRGWKGLICLRFDKTFDKDLSSAAHGFAFDVVRKYFEEQSILLDGSGRDITRSCFVGHDEKIVVKDEFAEFSITVPDLSGSKGKVKSSVASYPKEKVMSESEIKRFKNPVGKNNQIHRQQMKSILFFLRKKKLSITYDFLDWLRVGYAIAQSFSWDVGLYYFTELSKLDVDKFDQERCTAFLFERYAQNNGETTFRSIVYLAKLKGYNSTESKRE